MQVELDGWFCDVLLGWVPQPTVRSPLFAGEEGLAIRVAALKSHARKFNRAFVDGHVELEDFRKPFIATDEYLRRWNTDNEPHREIWMYGHE